MAATTIGRRFTQLIQHLGLSKNAFAQSLGKTATVVQHLVDERNKPGYDLLCKVFEVYPEVSKDWLLLGQGPMLLSGPAEKLGAPAKKAGVGAGAQAALLLSAAEAAPAGAATMALPDSAPAPAAPPTPKLPAAAPPALASAAPAGPPVPTPRSTPEVNPLPAVPAEPYLTAALHAQHLQHQLALAEQRNQHLLEQQRLMQQMLDLVQRG